MDLFFFLGGRGGGGCGGRGVAFVDRPCSDGITIKTPYGVDFLILLH